MRLIDAEVLRERMRNAGYSDALRHIDAARTVDVPQPLTRDGVLAAVKAIEDAGSKAVVEMLDGYDGRWYGSNPNNWVNPDNPRLNVRVRAVEVETEDVPLHEVIGRTPVGHNIAVRTVQYRRNPDGWIWDGGGEHCGSHLAVSDTGLVTVLKGEA